MQWLKLHIKFLIFDWNLHVIFDTDKIETTKGELPQKFPHDQCAVFYDINANCKYVSPFQVVLYASIYVDGTTD